MASSSVKCRNADFIPCADHGCMHRSRCCNSQVSGWYCATDAYCYTIGEMIDCYSTTEAVPTVTIKCVNYEDSGTTCTGTTSCRTCLRQQYPSCSTEVVVGLTYTNSQVNCWSTAGIGTVTAPDLLGTSTLAEFPTPTTTLDTINVADAATDSVITPRTTLPVGFGAPSPTPPAAAAGSSDGISTGAIAGIAIGGFVALALVAGGAWFLWGRGGRKGDDAQRALDGQGVVGGGGMQGGYVQPPPVEVEAHPAVPYYQQQPPYGVAPMGPVHQQGFEQGKRS